MSGPTDEIGGSLFEFGIFVEYISACLQPPSFVPIRQLVFKWHCWCCCFWPSYFDITGNKHSQPNWSEQILNNLWCKFFMCVCVLDFCTCCIHYTAQSHPFYSNHFALPRFHFNARIYGELLIWNWLEGLKPSHEEGKNQLIIRMCWDGFVFCVVSSVRSFFLAYLKMNDVAKDIESRLPFKFFTSTWLR